MISMSAHSTDDASTAGTRVAASPSDIAHVGCGIKTATRHTSDSNPTGSPKEPVMSAGKRHLHSKRGGDKRSGVIKNVHSSSSSLQNEGTQGNPPLIECKVSCKTQGIHKENNTASSGANSVSSKDSTVHKEKKMLRPRRIDEIRKTSRINSFPHDHTSRAQMSRQQDDTRISFGIKSGNRYDRVGSNALVELQKALNTAPAPKSATIDLNRMEQNDSKLSSKDTLSQHNYERLKTGNTPTSIASTYLSEKRSADGGKHASNCSRFGGAGFEMATSSISKSCSPTESVSKYSYCSSEENGHTRDNQRLMTAAREIVDHLKHQIAHSRTQSRANSDTSRSASRVGSAKDVDDQFTVSAGLNVGKTYTRSRSNTFEGTSFVEKEEDSALSVSMISSLHLANVEKSAGVPCKNNRYDANNEVLRVSMGATMAATSIVSREDIESSSSTVPRDSSIAIENHRESNREQEEILTDAGKHIEGHQNDIGTSHGVLLGNVCANSKSSMDGIQIEVLTSPDGSARNPVFSKENIKSSTVEKTVGKSSEKWSTPAFGNLETPDMADEYYAEEEAAIFRRYYSSPESDAERNSRPAERLTQMKDHTTQKPENVRHRTDGSNEMMEAGQLVGCSNDDRHSSNHDMIDEYFENIESQLRILEEGLDEESSSSSTERVD